MRDDVVRSGPDDRVADVLASIERSPYGFALVTSADGIVLGRVRASALDGDSEQVVGEVMELDPSTVRAHRAAGRLADELAEKNLRFAIVTTPEGRLLGVARREDLEQAG
jgi:CBS domain-containing protein